LQQNYLQKKYTRKPNFGPIILLQRKRKVLQKLIKEAKQTQFGIDHHFDQIKNEKDFANQVPRDYEALKPYVDKVKAKKISYGRKPLYFAKTSGTTSGAKYIPLTKESMPYHIEAARNAILHSRNGKADFVDGKMIFLQGSPLLEEKTE
jgi:hypothetical protein